MLQGRSVSECKESSACLAFSEQNLITSKF